MSKDPLASKNIGDHPVKVQVAGYKHFLDFAPESYEFFKDQDLRYGTNPSQTAALYAPSTGSFLQSLRPLKTGKEGPSLTNMEDIANAALTIGYFEAPSAIIMKHLNPSGFATQYNDEALAVTYQKAKDADFRAAFGGTVMINRPIDKDTGELIRSLFTEVLVAPGYEDGVVGEFKGSIRIFEYNEEQMKNIPRYTGDGFMPQLKTAADNKTIFREDPLLLSVKTTQELAKYSAHWRELNKQEMEKVLNYRGNAGLHARDVQNIMMGNRPPTQRELNDMITGYRIRLRSNSVRMIKDGYSVGLGTGQQDRVNCINIANSKNEDLALLARHEGLQRTADYSVKGSVLVSDGFFPKEDSIERAYQLGITAILAPHGGDSFLQVVKKANQYRIAFVDLPGEMRFFAHY